MLFAVTRSQIEKAIERHQPLVIKMAAGISRAA